MMASQLEQRDRKKGQRAKELMLVLPFKGNQEGSKALHQPMLMQGGPFGSSWTASLSNASRIVSSLLLYECLNPHRFRGVFYAIGS
jgi:hypothetical protein